MSHSMLGEVERLIRHYLDLFFVKKPYSLDAREQMPVNTL